MQTIGDLAKQPLSEPSEESRSETERPKLSQQAVDGIFTFLRGAYGPRWTGQFVDAKQVATHKGTWRYMLAGLSSGHIARGFATIREHAPDWPPNAVEFRRLCLGLPDRDSTIRRVRELRPGSDPVAHAIIERLPSWTVRHATYDELERAAHEHYTDAVAAIEHGELEALPAPIDAA